MRTIAGGVNRENARGRDYFSPIDDETQGWILTLARRGWSCRRVAATVGVDWATAARCLDGWGVARNRRGVAQ